MTRPPKPSIYTRLAALEGKKRGKWDVLQVLTAEEVVAAIATAIFQHGWRNAEAIAYALDCSIDEARITVAKMKELDALRRRERHKAKGVSENFAEQTAMLLSLFPDITARAREGLAERLAERRA